MVRLFLSTQRIVQYGQVYYFRVQAENGAGLYTLASNDRQLLLDEQAQAGQEFMVRPLVKQ